MEPMDISTPVKVTPFKDCVERAKEFAVPFYRDCFPFDEAITQAAITVMHCNDTKVNNQPFDTVTGCMLKFHPGWEVKLSYKARTLIVSIARDCPIIYSHMVHDAQASALPKETRQFLLDRIKAAVDKELLSDVEISHKSKVWLDKTILAKYILWPETSKPASADWGWVVHVKTGSKKLKFYLCDTPNATKWRVKEFKQRKGPKVRKSYTDVQFNEKMALKRQDPARINQVQIISKENPMPSKPWECVKEKIMDWICWTYPLDKVSWDQIKILRVFWKDDFIREEFYEPVGVYQIDKSPSAGYEIEFTFKDQSYLVISSPEGSVVKCRDFETCKRLPAPVVGKLREEMKGKIGCKVTAVKESSWWPKSAQPGQVLPSKAMWVVDYITPDGEKKALNVAID